MKIFLILFISAFFLQLQAQLAIAPQKDVSGNYTFQVGDVFFKVNPNHGARIESYKLNSLEFLSLDTHVADMYGSTAWLSPQSLWNWPPQVQIDKNAYTGGIDENTVILTSAQATADNGSLKFQMRKTFSADLQDSSISITYTIINKGTTSRSFAVWEIMRVPAGGISLFPLNGSITGDLAPFFMIKDGVAWWDYTTSETYKNKAFADGNGGWLAHISDNRMIHIKKFTDTQSNFPSNAEKEIEFYADGSRYYTEIEKHTDYKLIPANDSATMNMTWYLRTLPGSIALTEGNSQIISYINGILNPIPDNISIPVTSDFQLSVFPPVTAGEIEITGSAEAGLVSFTLMDILGKRIMNRIVSAGEKIQLEELNNGLYFYRLESHNKYFTGKVLIKK